MDELNWDAEPIEIIKSHGLKIEIYKKDEGPLPVSKSDCLHCNGDTIEYAYFNDGRNVVRRYCKSKECKQKSVRGVIDSVQRGSPINPMPSLTRTKRRIEILVDEKKRLEKKLKNSSKLED